MISGALNFTLGLQVNDFANKLGIAGGKLLAFTGITSALSTAMNKMWGSIQQGGKLNDLAAAANMSVKDLYQLQRAFEEVGASAESVPGVVNKLRRTLAGGEQNNLLASLGLDPTKLGAMDPAKQFEAIATSMSKLDDNAKAGAAFKIFGREGAQTMMQIANSGGDFAAAMKAAESDATIWQRVSKTFDEIGDKVTALMRHVETLWAGLTGTLIAAVKAKKMDQLIALTWAAGMEKAVTIFSAAIDAMAKIFAATFGSANLWKGMTETLIASFVSLGTELNEVLNGWAADAVPGGREKFDKAQNERREYAQRQVRDAAASLTAGTREATPAIMAAFKNAWNSVLTQGDAENKLREFVDGLLAGLGGKKKGAGGGAGDPLDLSKAGKSGEFKAPQFTNLEKIGLVLNGRGSGGVDYSRNTAENTRKSVILLDRIEKRIGGDGTNFSRIQ